MREKVKFKAHTLVSSSLIADLSAESGGFSSQVHIENKRDEQVDTFVIFTRPLELDTTFQLNS